MFHYRKRIQVLEQKNHYLEQQCAILRKNFSLHAELYHDMNHHLQVIHHMASLTNNFEIQQYIQDISMNIQEYASYVWTGVDIVVAILNCKKQVAENQGYSMQFNIELPNNTGIASEDFCSILSNLLDNALEAVKDVKESDTPHCIEVNIRRIHQFLMIQVKNPCSQNNIRKNSFLPTTKKDSSIHGLGLKNVKKAIAKYNGSFQYEIMNHTFCATALLFFPIDSDV